ncbi:MAG: CvpA family protein [Eubacteriales bacterium]
MNWLDYTIIFLIFFSALQGVRYGLLRSLARFAGVLAGAIVAYSYYRPFASYLTGNWRLDEKIFPLVEKIMKFWPPAQNPPPGKLTALSVSYATPPVGLPGQIFQPFDFLTRTFSGLAVEALSFFLLFFGVAWAINLAGMFLTRIAEISLLSPLNRLGGLAFGVLRGVAYVTVFLLILSPFQKLDLKTDPGATPPVSGKAFKESVLFPYFEPFLKIGGYNTNKLPGELKPRATAAGQGPRREIYYKRG